MVDSTLNAPEEPGADAVLEYLHTRPGFLVRRAHQICMSMFAETCEGLMITPTQYGILTALRHTPGIDQISVARKLGHDRSTAAMVINALHQRGLIVKVADAGDRRKNRLELSPEGLALWEKCHVLLSEGKDMLLEPLTPSERKQFLSLLTKFTHSYNSSVRTPLLMKGEKQ